MNKGLRKIGKTVADMSLVVTKTNVNTFSPLILFQPEMPKGYEKLRKEKCLKD